MKFISIMLAIGAFALAVASAATTYRVTISNPTWVAGKQLKPGDYRIEVEGDKAVIRLGKEVVEAPVKVETVDRKYTDTSINVGDSGGKSMLKEIRVGGTKTKLVFQPSAGPGGAE